MADSTAASRPALYVAETFWPSATEAAVREASARLATAAARLRERAIVVEFLGATWSPGDELLQARFEAAAEQSVHAVHALADVPLDRVVAAVDLHEPR